MFGGVSEQVWMSLSGNLFIVRFYADSPGNYHVNRLMLDTLDLCEAEYLGYL